MKDRAATLIEMVIDLNESLTCVNVEWSGWERGFIEDMKKLSRTNCPFSEKQIEVIERLWETL